MFKVTICDFGKMNINMTDKIEKKEATFAVPYNAAKNNFQESDAYEKMQFYYHPDHLGSSSYITNLEGAGWYSILSMYHCMKPCYRHLKLGGFTIGEYRPI